jgi:hypothetical protein
VPRGNPGGYPIEIKEQAMQRYLQLRPVHSLGSAELKVSTEFGCSLSSVRLWSSQYGWEDKLQEVQDDVWKVCKERLTKIREKQLNFAEELMDKVVERLRDGEGNISVKDFIDLSDHISKLAGGNVIRHKEGEVNINVGSENRDRTFRVLAQFDGSGEGKVRQAEKFNGEGFDSSSDGDNRGQKSIIEYTPADG